MKGRERGERRECEKEEVKGPKRRKERVRCATIFLTADEAGSGVPEKKTLSSCGRLCERRILLYQVSHSLHV